MVVAVVGLLVNVARTVVLSRSAGENLNMQGALRHILADLLCSVGVIAAALVIVLTGWSYADPLISVLIGFLAAYHSRSLHRPRPPCNLADLTLYEPPLLAGLGKFPVKPLKALLLDVQSAREEVETF